jgi:hypothetical protein
VRQAGRVIHQSVEADAGEFAGGKRTSGRKIVGDRLVGMRRADQPRIKGRGERLGDRRNGERCLGAEAWPRVELVLHVSEQAHPAVIRERRAGIADGKSEARRLRPQIGRDHLFQQLIGRLDDGLHLNLARAFLDESL